MWKRHVPPACAPAYFCGIGAGRANGNRAQDRRRDPATALRAGAGATNPSFPGGLGMPAKESRCESKHRPSVPCKPRARAQFPGEPYNALYRAGQSTFLVGWCVSLCGARTLGCEKEISQQLLFLLNATASHGIYLGRPVSGKPTNRTTDRRRQRRSRKALG